MTVQEVFIQADEALKTVIDGLEPTQLALDLPPELSRGGKFPTLASLVNGHAYDEAWVPDVLAGKTITEVGDKYDADFTASDPVANYDKRNAAGQAAVGAFKDLDMTVHLSYGDYPAAEYLRHIISFRGFQAYDIAKFSKQDTTLPDKLVEGMWEVLEPVMDDYRKMGVFGPAVEVSGDAPLQDRLLALAGRDPGSAA